MANVAKRRLARKSHSLPLFEWADRRDQTVFEPLRITNKLAGNVDISPSVLNAMAEAAGYKGREASNV